MILVMERKPHWIIRIIWLLFSCKEPGKDNTNPSFLIQLELPPLAEFFLATMNHLVEIFTDDHMYTLNSKCINTECTEKEGKIIFFKVW